MTDPTPSRERDTSTAPASESGASLGESAALRVAIVYQVLHHFREPIFRSLTRDPRLHCTFLAAAENTLDSNETIDPVNASLPVDRGGLRWRFVKNRALPAGLIWQQGVVSIAWSRDFDTIVYLGNVHYLSTWIGAALARLMGKRVFMWGHGLTRPEAGAKWWLRRLFYRLPHAHLLYGHRAKRLLADRGLDPARLHVVYNSLDYTTQRRIRDELRPEDLERARERLFAEPGLPVLCCIGRVDRRKRIDQLLAAAAELAERGQPVNVLLIGDGPDRGLLEDQARRLRLEDRVCFYGACYDEEEIGPLLSLSTLCVCPGHTGLTAIHAMAYGVPVITHDDLSAHAPESEVIEPGSNGDLYDSTDDADLCRCVADWLSSDRDRSQVRKRCIDSVERHYTPEVQTDLIAGFLQEDATRG